MSHNKANMYDAELHVAEIYDQSETYTDDVVLIRRLIGTMERGGHEEGDHEEGDHEEGDHEEGDHEGRPYLRILEPFCGTGRILIPLALDGHELVGIDLAQGMLARARAKIERLPADVQRRISLTRADAIDEDWPRGFDLVILGGNCFYELATPQEQERCIASAAASLNPGGTVYVDNDHMEGDLDEAWRQPGVSQGFPTGTCLDGTTVESANETVWFDVPRRLVRFRRWTKVTLPDGSVVENEYVQQKHPVSTIEVQTWPERHGFVVERVFGDRAGNPYTEASERAVFWARKR